MSAYSQLLFVFIKGRVECVEVLIAAKADVNARDNDEDTALLQAVGGGHIDVVRLLLTAGADVQVPCCAHADTRCGCEPAYMYTPREVQT